MAMDPRVRPSGARASTAVAGGILLSRLTGLLRESLLRSVLALGPAADAFAAALRIPNLLQNLLGEGSLSASFIPVYSRLLGEGRREEAGRVAAAVAGLLTAVTGLLVVVAMVAARPLATMLAPGFDGRRLDLTVDLIRITTAGLGLLVLSAWCLGVLNSHGRFFLPYVSPVLSLSRGHRSGLGTSRRRCPPVWRAGGGCSPSRPRTSTMDRADPRPP